MIKQNTVLILGAGASVPFGYPTGFELRKYICNDFKNDWMRISKRDEKLLKQIDEFTKAFASSLNMSIDLFLSRNKKFEKIGKIAIIQQILKAERNSKEPSNIFDKPNWISYLYERLTKKFTDDSYYKIADNKLKIITFNYDRLVENSIYKALCNSFTLTNMNLFEQEMFRFGIMHVYGKIAPLDWEQEEGLKYKVDLRSIKILNYLENIKVLYDQREIPNRAYIDSTLQKAKRIFFLGFGYADENLDVLNIKDNFNKYQRIFGTAKDLTNNEIEKIRNKFSSLTTEKYYNEIIIENCDNLTLLRNYL